MTASETNTATINALIDSGVFGVGQALDPSTRQQIQSTLGQVPHESLDEFFQATKANPKDTTSTFNAFQTIARHDSKFNNAMAAAYEVAKADPANLALTNTYVWQNKAAIDMVYLDLHSRQLLNETTLPAPTAFSTKYVGDGTFQQAQARSAVPPNQIQELDQLVGNVTVARAAIPGNTVPTGGTEAALPPINNGTPLPAKTIQMTPGTPQRHDAQQGGTQGTTTNLSSSQPTKPPQGPAVSSPHAKLDPDNHHPVAASLPPHYRAARLDHGSLRSSQKPTTSEADILMGAELDILHGSDKKHPGGAEAQLIDQKAPMDRADASAITQKGQGNSWGAQADVNLRRALHAKPV